MNEIITAKMCHGCGKEFTTTNGDNFCSRSCETYFDRFLDDHEEDEV